MSVNIKPYIIINGKNSNEITGLMITKLPPISKPAMRVEAEEIDGRDGDIVTELGFSAYDKEIEIGLYGEYDVNDVIEYFNQSGQVIFSNEPDKYYRFAIYNAIDFEKLINFKTATVTFHVQPFKFDVVSNDAVFFSPSNVSITNDGNIYSRPELAISGSGNVGISVNGSDVLEVELGAKQQAIIIDSDGMNAYGTKTNIKELIVDVNPVQDLHGYDSPWVGGAGKNKLNILPFADWQVIRSYVCCASHFSQTRLKMLFFDKDTSVSIDGINLGFYDTNWTGTPNITSAQYRWVVSNGTILSENRNIPTNGDTSIFLDGLILYPNTEESYNSIFSRYNIMVVLENETATSFEPYENICPISGWHGCDVTRTGANIWGGEALLQSFIDANISGFTYDTTVKTMRFSATSVSTKPIYFKGKFKPNTAYTFIFSGENSTANTNTNLRLYYTDGTYNTIQWDSALANTKQTKAFVTSANKTIDCLRGVNASGNTTLYYDECGFFEGTITADDFQRYVGNPYQLFFEGLINGTYGYVDMGTLTWAYVSQYGVFQTSALPPAMKASPTNMLCEEYPFKGAYTQLTDKSIGYIFSDRLAVKDSTYGTDAEALKSALSGKYVIYPLATPTTPTITQAELDMLQTAFGIDGESAIVSFGQTVYGAKLNVTTGVMTIEYMLGEFKSSDYWAWNSSLKGFRKTKADAQLSASDEKLLCNAFKKLSSSQDGCGILFRDTYFDFVNLDQIGITDVASWQALINSFGGSIFVTYKLSQPIEVQLTAQEIMTIIGENVLWADTGDINELIYTKDGVDITTSGDIVSFDVDAIDIKDNILKNRLVTGNYDGLRLKAGTNQIAVSGNVNVMVLSNFSRWL